MAVGAIPPVPRQGALLIAWLMRLRAWLNIKLSAPTVQYLTLEENHEEPPRPADGTMARADGTDWDPGGGGGVYVYMNSTWHKAVGAGP